MTKKELAVLIVTPIILGAVLFQFFFRYKRAEIGIYDLKFDSLMSEAYFKVSISDKKEWQKLGSIDSYRKAKYTLEKKYYSTLIDISDIEFKLDEIESKLDNIESEISYLR